MATEKEMYEVLGRALADETFRAALIEDPVKAAEGIGINLSEEQAAGLKQADFGQALEDLDERLSKLYFRARYLYTS